MTATVIIMIIVGIIVCLASFFVSEKIADKEDTIHSKLMNVEEDYEFSDRELRIIRRKIEDVIANQAKDILYETNESLSNMANEKTMALGDYAVAVCDQIESNHKEVMFLYSMLDDKQKEIMKTVELVNGTKQDAKDVLTQIKNAKNEHADIKNVSVKKSAIEQLTAISQEKKMNESIDKNVSLEELSDTESSYQEDRTDYISKTTDDLFTEKESINEKVFEKELSTEEKAEFSGNDEDIFSEIDQTEIDFDEVLESEFIENENSNDIILEMYRNGNSILAIAKELGLGVGEVKLVIDLYQGE